MSSKAPFALRGSYRHSNFSDKDVDIAAMERDAGFCSGGDDEELDDLHSPTDVSEDSVEVKVEPICLRNKNKRKCAEPRKVANDETVLQPYKKRRHFIQESALLLPEDRYHVKNVSVSPFRPWSHALDKSCTQVFAQYTERVPALPDQDEPLSLVLRSPTKSRERRSSTESSRFDPTLVIKSEFPSVQTRLVDDGDGDGSKSERRLLDDEGDGSKRERRLLDDNGDGSKRERRLLDDNGDDDTGKRLACVVKEVKQEPGTLTRPREDDYRLQSVEAMDFTMIAGPSRVADCPRSRRTLSEMANEDRVVCSAEDLSPHKYQAGTSTSTSTSSDKKHSPGGSNQHRNYKNMTRERRVEANARERTRVHTISAAFDTLRRTIPAYSHNQKLSKLSVLRIACSYILTLSRVAGSDYSADNSEPSLADCVDYVSRTIQTEGKLRKKKED